MSLRARVAHRRLLRSLAGPQILTAFAAAHPDAYFVEVGANDGDQHDHLRPHILAQAWRGVMVEPVPYVFERLRANYADVAGVVLENVAIAAEDGDFPFFYLAQATEPDDRQGLPPWYDTLGSLSRDAVLGHANHIPDIAERLVEARVPAITFESLLARHGADRVDLVVIDTEGHDWEVLKTIDIERWQPRLIIHEHFHLDRDEREASREHLRRCGYELLEEGFDTFSLAPKPDTLTRRFRRLSPGVPAASARDERS